MAKPVYSATERLAHHLARPVEPDSRDQARLHLLDWLGCVAGARRSDVSAIAKVSQPDAVMRAAFLGNVLEMDDVHRTALLHPGPVVWPSVMAAVRIAHGPISTILDSAVRGYEAMIAIGETYDAHHYAHWHNTATAGGFGAAAAAASVFALDPRQTVWALGNAGSVAGGLWHMRHCSGAMTKQFHIAHAVRTGLSASSLARHGFAGPPEILEGPQGIWAAMAHEPKPLELAGNWRMSEVSFKPWAACRHAHPAIDAALALKRQGALSGPILVETYADAVTFCDRADPTTATEAKFSLQHSVAVVASMGEPKPEHFEPQAIGDAGIAAARTRVEVMEAPEITSRYPAHFGARVSAGGQSVEVVDTLGDPERPLPQAGVMDKARQLIAWGGLPASEAERAISIALESDDPRLIFALLEDWV
jgi:2-methylcitrate dehydratase PrpD